jgi:hypothetical protein
MIIVLYTKRHSHVIYHPVQELCAACSTPERHMLTHAHSMDWERAIRSDNHTLQYFEKDSRSSGLLIIMRHGQSVWNRKPDQPDATWRYAGTVDIPLSDVGIQEALQAGEFLQNIPLDLVFCSQMDRARATVHSSQILYMISIAILDRYLCRYISS